MKQLFSTFPWQILVYCLIGWISIILLHALFIAIAPKVDGEVDVIFRPEKKRIIEDGNNLFAFSWWNLCLIAIAHFIKLWKFIPWVSLVISAIFSLPGTLSFVIYFFTSLAIVLFDRTCYFRAKIVILISIFSNLICTALLLYTTYSIYMIYIA